MIQKITSAQNSLIKISQKLAHSGQERRKKNKIVLDGIHLVQEIIKTNNTQNIDHLFYSIEGLQNKEIASLIQKVNPKKCVEVPQTLMTKIAPTKTPTGILAIAQKPAPSPLKNEKFIMLLDQIQDPGNLGTIFRTGVSLGVEAFFCATGTVEVWHPKVLRAAQGAHFYTKIFDNFKLETIKTIFDGPVYGLFLDPTAKHIFQTDLKGKIAICLGNEGQGISPEVAQICDKKIYIPMQQNFESLNVGIASGICCAEKMRQEGRV